MLKLENGNVIQHDVIKWYDIVQIKLSNTCLFGLKADGTVVTSDRIEQNEYSNWNNVIYIDIDKFQIGGGVYGIKKDGTLIGTDYDLKLFENVNSIENEKLSAKDKYIKNKQEEIKQKEIYTENQYLKGIELFEKGYFKEAIKCFTPQYKNSDTYIENCNEKIKVLTLQQKHKQLNEALSDLTDEYKMHKINLRNYLIYTIGTTILCVLTMLSRNTVIYYIGLAFMAYFGLKAAKEDYDRKITKMAIKEIEDDISKIEKSV